ncbi:3-octaprenyl-4-hydroxybenzoate carboxy-lyase [Candidatus Methanoperedenaceae archaeon GB50]|nr:3-octaprenyl-4-hydroxybenzoate carboxy-lyase [Candidatus Methanoperedenaceae archaeon GB50]CAD7775642.1 MAG: 3-octaprenyl-4-hydroxybenzoate carboxy-lyase [Candidatus Methanoperedenaceae archaeon GB50]
MSFFSSFVESLERDGLLKVIERPVSPVYEVTRVVGDSVEPLLFTDVSGWRVVVNLLGTREMLSRALGIPVDRLARTLAGMRSDGLLKVVDEGPAMDAMDVDLGRLPILTHHSGDGGAYITGGVVISEYGGVTNASIHRLMVIGRDKLVARIVEGRHTDTLSQMARRDGEPLPVAIAIGVDPVTLYAVCTRVPEGREFQFASALKGEPVELFRSGNGLMVPECEFLLEGYLDPEEVHTEGPFVDITGTYDSVREQPVIQITGISRSSDPIYHAILPASGEHRVLMGVPYEPLIYREASRFADVRNVVMSDGGCSYLHAVVQIMKRSKSEVRDVIEAAFRAHGSLKHVVVVDEDIDILDPRDVEYAIATRVQADRDIHIYRGQRGSSLDPSRGPDGRTAKMGVDATFEPERRDEYLRVDRENLMYSKKA